MYGKLFAQMFDGSLYGQWQAIVTLQQLVILCDEDGVIDITPPALAARTSIPIEIINKGLELLGQPDPNSRSAAEDGRRIVPLDDHRPWGWRIVNHAKYRNMRSREDVREANRERKRKSRAARHALSHHTDTDTDTDKEAHTSESLAAPPPADSRLGVLEATKAPEFEQLASDLGLDLEAFREFIDYRWRIRKPLRAASIQSAAKLLAKYGTDQRAVVEQTIGNGWQGLRELQNRRDRQGDAGHRPVVFLAGGGRP